MIIVCIEFVKLVKSVLVHMLYFINKNRGILGKLHRYRIKIIWCRILRLQILREISRKTRVQLLRKGGGGQFSLKYRNVGSISSATLICWNFLKSVVLGIWYKQHYMVNVISSLCLSPRGLGLVSALALRARADNSPSGWDTGWEHIYHVILYMSQFPLYDICP